MSSPLLTAEGVFDHATVDPDGQLRVSMIDLLATVRIGADTEILLVAFTNGTSHAWRLSEILLDDHACLRLEALRCIGAEQSHWAARLWTSDRGLSERVDSIAAMTFASFVGLS
jgi:hypothetical protein